MNKHETAPAKIARIGMRYGQSKTRSNRRVNRVTAALKDIPADLSRYAVLGRNHAAFGHNGVMHCAEVGNSARACALGLLCQCCFGPNPN